MAAMLGSVGTRACLAVVNTGDCYNLEASTVLGLALIVIPTILLGMMARGALRY